MPVYMWYRIKIVNRPCWVAIYVQYKKSEEGLWTSYADFLAMGFYDQEGTIDAAKAQAESYLAPAYRHRQYACWTLDWNTHDIG